MTDHYSKIMEQLDRRELELHERKEQLKDLVLDITESERERIIKKAGKDFFFFAKKIFPEYCSKPFSDLHRDIKNFALKKERKVEVIAAPPETGKTSLLRICKIWMHIYGIRNYIIKVTETMSLSLIDLASIKLEYEENPRLIFLYGNLKTEGKWSEEAFKAAPTKWNKYGTWFEAFAFGVPPTGRLREQFRPDFCDIDDLENYRKSGNIEISKEKLEFINNDIIPRMSMDAAVIWFGNNARKTMAMNIIIEMEPAVRTRDYPAFAIHIYTAWNRITNKALWKEVYQFDSEEEMRLFFGVGLMTWMGNYMQCPVVPDGLEFKKENWSVYKKLPADAVGIMMIDPASGKSGCYKAGLIILFSKETSKFYVTTCFVRQCDWEYLFLWMYEAYAQYEKHIRFIGWEKDFHQDQYLLFRRLYASTKDRPELPIRPIDVKGNGPKDERIRSLSVPYERGNILFAEDFLLNKDGQEAQLHLIGFPDYSFKDFADAFASGYREVFKMFAGYSGPLDSGRNIYESVSKTKYSRDVH